MQTTNKGHHVCMEYGYSLFSSANSAHTLIHTHSASAFCKKKERKKKSAFMISKKKKIEEKGNEKNGTGLVKIRWKCVLFAHFFLCRHLHTNKMRIMNDVLYAA